MLWCQVRLDFTSPGAQGGFSTAASSGDGAAVLEGGLPESFAPTRGEALPETGAIPKAAVLKRRLIQPGAHAGPERAQMRRDFH